MNQALERQTFSVAEREQIRKKLLFYMKEHRIGVPALAKRIDIALQRKPGLVVKTLQRFLAGRMRTHDPFMAVCYRFAAGLAAPDLIAELGERLSIFYGAGTGHDYSGIYVSDSGVIDADFMLGQNLPGSSLIEISAQAGFYRVTEKVVSEIEYATYDGVLVCSGEAAVVLLKDRLTNLARNYMLWPENDGMCGRGGNARFASGYASEIWGLTKGFEPVSLRLRKK
jgi:hypothetical protein